MLISKQNDESHESFAWVIHNKVASIVYMADTKYSYGVTVQAMQAYRRCRDRYRSTKEIDGDEW
jgi:hypothetical protein